jgi:hypothetical protein
MQGDGPIATRREITAANAVSCALIEGTPPPFAGLADPEGVKPFDSGSFVDAVHGEAMHVYAFGRPAAARGQ